MKLFISSYRTPSPEKFFEFIGQKPLNTKIGIILNAKDYNPLEVRKEKTAELFNYFINLGALPTEIDLRKFENKPEGLLQEFLKYNCIWLAGGNTYTLRYALFKAGAEKVIKQALLKGVTYAGESAGAIVAGPTLKHFEEADDPKDAKQIIYEGLNFIDFCPLVHWENIEYQNILEKAEQELIKEGFKTKRLKDNEFLLINA